MTEVNGLFIVIQLAVLTLICCGIMSRLGRIIVLLLHANGLKTK